MIKIATFILLILVGNSYCIANTIDTSAIENGKILLLTDEKFVDALQLFTNNLKTTTNNKEAIAENIYWIAECLFQLRKNNELKRVIETGERYMLQHHLYNKHAVLMQVKAKYLIDIGNPKEAIQLLNNNKIKNDKVSLLNEKCIIADAYYKNGELEQSRRAYQYVINNSNDTIQIAQAYNGIGSIYYLTSDFDSSFYCYNVAHKLYKNKVGLLNTRTALVQTNLSLIEINKGNYSVAEKLTQTALKTYIIKYGNHHTRTAEAYGLIGAIYKLQDNLDKAILYLNKESDILKNIYGDNNEKLIYSHMNLAEVYTITKNYTKANDEIEKAIYLVKNQNNHQDNLYIQCVVKYCNLKAIEKDYNSSNQLLLALIQENKHHDNDYIADAYHQLGCNYLAQKNFKEAIKNFETANKIYQQFFGDKNVYSIDPLTEISNAYLQENKPSEALKYALLALAQTEENAKTIYPYDHWECIVQILKCKKEMYVIQPTSIKNYKEDIDLIKQTISEAKTIKQTYYTNGSQMHYAEKMSQLHMLGIFYLTHFYKKIDAYFLDNLLYFSDNNKANLLRYKISSDASTEILPTNESNKLHAITDKLNYFIALNENQANVAFNLNDSIFYYQNKHELFTKYIEQKYPKVYAIKYGQKSFTAKEIQDKLKENYTFLNYCNDGENYYCLSISTQNINYKICGNKSKIDTLIKTYQTNLINLKFNNALNKELSQYLLPKTLNKNLLIATDEMLQDISFDVLHENATNNYLIYNHSIQYTFSASTYFKHQTITQNKSTIAFFPNFINTKYAVLNYNKENKSLQAFANYSKFQDSLATKKSFLEVYKKANVIHIASHLIIDTLFPLHSSLLFQSNNDCALTINDIWKLNANMQLITLAACHSNFGKTQNGEGMQNFVWAFQYAGAHNVLSTQWNASDKSTANIISQFYAELRKGKSKEEALRLSKINYLEQADAIGIQPFFWANYCLFADETDIKIKSHFITNYWWLICVVIALFISIFYVRQQIKN